MNLISSFLLLFAANMHSFVFFPFLSIRLKSFLLTNTFRLAVNQQYLLEGDLIQFSKESEVALLPPFGGG